MKQFIDIEKCAGKTIASVHYLSFTQSSIVILFTDGSYSNIEAVRGYDCAELESSALDESYGDEAVRIGVATQDEIAAYRAEQKLREAEWQRRRDLKTLAELKARYE